MPNNILNQLQATTEHDKKEAAPIVKNEAYDKKISYLKHKIIFNLCFSCAFFL